MNINKESYQLDKGIENGGDVINVIFPLHHNSLRLFKQAKRFHIIIGEEGTDGSSYKSAGEMPPADSFMLHVLYFQQLSSG